jgi:hypothetical protein
VGEVLAEGAEARVDLGPHERMKDLLDHPGRHVEANDRKLRCTGKKRQGMVMNAGRSVYIRR